MAHSVWSLALSTTIRLKEDLRKLSHEEIEEAGKLTERDPSNMERIAKFTKSIIITMDSRELFMTLDSQPFSWQCFHLAAHEKSLHK